jgi:hypothetical protein
MGDDGSDGAFGLSRLNNGWKQLVKDLDTNVSSGKSKKFLAGLSCA